MNVYKVQCILAEILFWFTAILFAALLVFVFGDALGFFR